VCQINGSDLVKYTRIHDTSGNKCGYVWDRVVCSTITVCYGEYTTGCSGSSAPPLPSYGIGTGSFTDFLTCDWAYSHPHNTDLVAAQTICAQNGLNAGPVFAKRVYSGAGNKCGYTFVRATCH
jgi:hypothetical protein